MQFNSRNATGNNKKSAGSERDDQRVKQIFPSMCEHKYLVVCVIQKD